MSCDTAIGWKAKDVLRDCIEELGDIAWLRDHDKSSNEVWKLLDISTNIVVDTSKRELIEYFSSCPLISDRGEVSNERDEGY
ncbi:hypothetical protein TorRG33x02_119470 [Trema orientale]|uniref:Uncharacterized protein n=1 Tax=Trema orientale TaxID=63057 RepID=A0A2P5F3G0_TREOI|nr:hypothetical protein TorRG33x02_119470 [Trema orientale]